MEPVTCVPTLQYGNLLHCFMQKNQIVQDINFKKGGLCVTLGSQPVNIPISQRPGGLLENSSLQQIPDDCRI